MAHNYNFRFRQFPPQLPRHVQTALPDKRLSPLCYDIFHPPIFRCFEKDGVFQQPPVNNSLRAGRGCLGLARVRIEANQEVCRAQIADNFLDSVENAIID